MPIRLTSIDYRAINQLMARSSELRGDMQQRLSAAKTYAESIAPDGPPVGAGYKYAFATEIHQFPDGVPIGTLYNSDPLWVLVEFGSSAGRPQGGSSPAQHVLSRTLQFMQRSP